MVKPNKATLETTLRIIRSEREKYKQKFLKYNDLFIGTFKLEEKVLNDLLKED